MSFVSSVKGNCEAEELGHGSDRLVVGQVLNVARIRAGPAIRDFSKSSGDDRVRASHIGIPEHVIGFHIDLVEHHTTRTTD